MKIKKLLFAFAAVAATVLFGTSCAKSLVVEEILQIPVNGKIYTAYNIWYEDPANVSSVNYLKGSILPFGTQVEILRASDCKITFRTVADKKEFTVNFEQEYRMQSAEEFIRNLFTHRDRKTMTEGVPAVNVEKLRRGLIDIGMSKQEVRLAYGPPCKFKTPDENLNTWLFWTELLVGKRIVFNNEKVTDILVL
ncbi:MAG: hypothetical protein IKB16_01605 [Lentisphaeria bacterium]|nr:hypothetical protein [Lentisphaeria bacterium]